MTYRYHMRGNSLIKKLMLVMSEGEQAQIIEAMRTVRKPMVVSFLNAHAFNLAWKETDFRRSLVESDLLLRDGIGVSILLALLGIRPGLNMNGTDLIPKVLERCHGSVVLLGTRDPYLSMAAARLREAGTDVAITLDGFQPDSRYLDAVRESHPSVVILAMGMPKQERVALALKEAITWPCLIVNGGAILDFMSGRVIRAPGMLRILHLEWLFRLAREPRRLWRRYVLGNSVFLFRSLRIWRSLKPNRDHGRTLV
jgi:exopolysaccharide biosynthesis WecB/TagA/CpsF family protein